MMSRAFALRKLPQCLATAVLSTSVFLVAPAFAVGTGSIDHVQSEDGNLQILYSVPGLQPGQTPDLDSVAVTVNGTSIDARADLAATASQNEGIERIAVLAIDVSKSMRGERFEQAKLAARAFLEGVSDDVRVGIVSFAGAVTTEQEPSLDREASLKVLEGLELSLETQLYNGVLEAVAATGSDGPRSVLVLSDGRDTSNTELEAVAAAVEDSDVKVDVVALAQNEAGLVPLRAIAESGRGRVLFADDPGALVKVFASEAESLAQQVLVTTTLPSDLTATEGTLNVSIEAAGQAFSDSAFVPLRPLGSEAAIPAVPRSAPGPIYDIPPAAMLGGLIAAAVGVLLLVLLSLGVISGTKPQTVEERISAYARSNSAAGGQGRLHAAQTTAPGVKGSALMATERALAANADLAAGIGVKLEAAGMSLKASEWVLLHAGIALLCGVVGLLLGGLPGLAIFLVFGAALPWLYLGIKRSRRVNAFNSQLADTLQLISGGLSAGLSLAQSVDTVVRQGSEPMVTEFKRALAEARLGVSIEDALESIAVRMQSRDFKWVVIAVRIQREVGGNLAEVLTQVAATIRERDYLKRQVKSLSAEGKMSAYILGGLPLVVFGFLMMTNPAYFTPMFTNLLGWVLIGVALTMLAIAAFWMSRMIKLEV